MSLQRLREFVSQRGCGARQELLHHAGAGADFRRLSERLSPARLAAAWSHVATRLRGEGRAEGAATFMAAEPAMVACMAALLPEMDHVSTLIVVGATPCMLCSSVHGRRCCRMGLTQSYAHVVELYVVDFLC